MDMITPKQAELLDLIEAGHDTINSLAAQTGLHVVTIQNRAATLQDAGLVTRRKAPPQGMGRPPHIYTRTSKPRPKVGKRISIPTRRQATPPPPPRPSQLAEPTGTFDHAPRLTIASDTHWGLATREHVELVAKEALSKRPVVNGRRAITARHLAHLTGMPYLDALGALERLAEARGQPVQAYRPEGKCTTFYLGPKYKPHRDFGTRRRPKPTPTASA